MSKRIGPLAVVAVLAIGMAAAIVAQAQSDPAELSCTDEFGSIGFNEPSAESYHPTPIEAAAAFVSETEVDGGPLPADVKLIDVTPSNAAAAASGRDEKVFAAQVDGHTLLLLNVAQGERGWAVQRDVSC